MYWVEVTPTRKLDCCAIFLFYSSNHLESFLIEFLKYDNFQEHKEHIPVFLACFFTIPQHIMMPQTTSFLVVAVSNFSIYCLVPVTWLSVLGNPTLLEQRIVEQVKL